MKPESFTPGESATNPYEVALRGISSPERCAALAGVALQLQIHHENLHSTLWAIQVGAELAGRFNDDLLANCEEGRPDYVTLDLQVFPA